MKLNGQTFKRCKIRSTERRLMIRCASHSSIASKIYDMIHYLEAFSIENSIRTNEIHNSSIYVLLYAFIQIHTEWISANNIKWIKWRYETLSNCRERAKKTYLLYFIFFYSFLLLFLCSIITHNFCLCRWMFDVRVYSRLFDSSSLFSNNTIQCITSRYKIHIEIQTIKNSNSLSLYI